MTVNDGDEEDKTKEGASGEGAAKVDEDKFWQETAALLEQTEQLLTQSEKALGSSDEALGGGPQTGASDSQKSDASAGDASAETT